MNADSIRCDRCAQWSVSADLESFCPKTKKEVRWHESCPDFEDNRILQRSW